MRAPAVGEWDVGLRRAARELAPTAPESAAAYLGVAAEHCPGDYSDWASLDLERASLYNTVGRPREAREIVRRLLARWLAAKLELTADRILVVAQILLGEFNREDLEVHPFQ